LVDRLAEKLADSKKKEQLAALNFSTKAEMKNGIGKLAENS
jgi:hypothetical protein